MFGELPLKEVPATGGEALGGGAKAHGLIDGIGFAEVGAVGRQDFEGEGVLAFGPGHRGRGRSRNHRLVYHHRLWMSRVFSEQSGGKELRSLAGADRLPHGEPKEAAARMRHLR